MKKQSRRKFLESASLLALGGLTFPMWAEGKGQDRYIVGHGDFRYEINAEWGALDPARYPMKDAHEMVMDRKGRLILLTNEVQNNVLIYDRSGKLLTSWGNEFPGGHGLTIVDEGGEEVLFICDYERHEVIKTTLEGKHLLTIGWPEDSGKYQSKDQFKPTETAIAPNGDIYVTDGYGEQYISVFDAKGKLKFIFGGREEFQNAHGICFDHRKGKTELLITARAQNALKRFDPEGLFLGKIDLPGAFINRPVIHGDNVYLSVLRCSVGGDASGFLMVLDKENQVVSCPTGSTPGNSSAYHQTIQLFQHPHDVCVDGDENLYIPQWNSGGAYPIQLKRV